MSRRDAASGRAGSLLRFISASARRLEDDHAFQMAGSLTFTTLLSLVPLVAVVVSFVAAIPVFRVWTSAVDDYIVQNLLPGSIGKVLLGYFEQFAQRATRLKALGSIVLGVTALLTMLTIDRSFNQIFRVIRPRPLLRRVLVYLTVLTIGPVLMGLSISMTSYLVSASLGLVKGLPLIGEAVLRLVPFLLTATALAAIYVLVPNRKVEARHAVVGALVAGVLFEILKRGFGLYVARFPTYTVVYGAFAAVPIFLVWLYLSWLIVIYGATLTAMLPGYRVHRRARSTRLAGASLAEALAILERLASVAPRTAVPLSDIAQRVGLSTDATDRLLMDMQRRGWTRLDGIDGWRLARSADAIPARAVVESQTLEPAIAERMVSRWPALRRLLPESPPSRGPDLSLRELFEAGAPDAAGRMP